MKVLLTGANGFIGKNIYEQLNHKYEIIRITRKEVDLLDSKEVFKLIKKIQPEYVIHSAHHDPFLFNSNKEVDKILEYNLKMFFNIVSSSSYFYKMFYFGSGAEFNREYWMPKMKESYFGKYIPKEQYGFSKYVMNSYIENRNDIVNLRLFTVFGKYDDYKARFISNMCYQIMNDSSLLINQNKKCDFLYIDDLVKIVDWMMENPIISFTDYNICSGQVHSFKDIAKRILKMANKNLDIKINKKGLGLEYSGDNSRLLAFNDFKFTPIDEAIGRTYTWLKDNV